MPWFAIVRPNGAEAITALVVLVLSVTSGGVLAFARTSLLPARFSYDSTLIQRLAKSGDVGGVDGSYRNTAELYRVLGLQNAPLVVTALSFVAIIALVLAALRVADPQRLRLDVSLVAAVAILIGSVYVTTYSKDICVLLVAAVLLSVRGYWGELVLLAAIASYAAVFRPYWWLLLAVYVALRCVFRVHSRPWAVLVCAIVSIAAIGMLFWLALHVDPDHFRTSVNDLRTGDADAHTMIEPLFGLPEPLGGLLNVLVTAVMLVLPLPLALDGGTYYLGVFVLITLLWGSFWTALWLRGRAMKNAATWVRAVCMLIALLVVQAFFEPDYGSALRHLSPLLCLFVVVCAAVRRSSRASRPQSATRGEAVDAHRRGGRSTQAGLSTAGA